MSDTVLTDTVGDEAAARNGGPRRSAVPRYRRFGGGRILGLDAGLRIAVHDERGGADETGGLSVTPGGRKATRYVDGRALRASASKRIVGRRGEPRGAGEDFVAVGKSRAAEQAEEALWIGHQFAGTETKGNGERSDDDEVGEEEEEEEEEGESPTGALQRRIAQLDARARAAPESVDTWLDLVDAQAELVAAQHGDAGRRSTVAQAQRDVQLAVIERSMAAHPDNRRSVKMSLKRLDIVSQGHGHHWQPGAIDDEWRSILRTVEEGEQDEDRPGKLFDLWTRYLDWRSSGGLDDFTVSKMEELLQYALSRFRALYFQGSSTNTHREALELAMMRLVKRTVLLLREAGLVERAHSLLQALCELTFNRPSKGRRLDSAEGLESALYALAEFWDLELARIGEVGARGWASFAADPAGTVERESKPTPSDGTLTGATGEMPVGLSDPDAFTRWSSLEAARARLRKRQPAKATRDQPDWTTGESEVDPFSFVLFDDVRGYMVLLSTKRARLLLLDAFLAHLGFPAGLLSEDQDGYNDGDEQAHLVHPAISKVFWPACLEPSQTIARSWDIIGGEIMERERQSGLARPFEMPVRSAWPDRIDTLFPRTTSDPRWFSMMARAGVSSSDDDDDKARAEAARLLLEQVQDEDMSTEVGLARMALAAATQGPKAASRVAKKLLAAHRDDVDLWRGYAQLQRNSGDLDTARTVFRSVVQQSPRHSQLAAVWASWAELELFDAASNDGCLDVIALAVRASLGQTDDAQVTPVSPADKLRARRFFVSETRAEEREHSTHTTRCAAMFEYASRPRDEALMAPADVIWSSPQDERLAMFLARLAWHHVHQRERQGGASFYRPAEVRSILKRAVEQYPSNTALWSLFGAFEMRAKVQGVFRAALEEADRQQKATVTASLLRIYAELHMNAHQCNEGAVRTLFERATEHGTSVVLWRLYLDFEVRVAARAAPGAHAKAALKRAGQVLYRALARCPYSRALYLAAFRPPLRGAMSNDELRTLARLMEERHVRCYSSLDAFLAGSAAPEDEEEE